MRTAALLALFWAGIAAADCPRPEGVGSASISSKSDAERLRFLASNLGQQSDASLRWTLGWGLTYGVLTRRVAVMPLTKVTDMSYNVTLVGRLLSYGQFVFESAGQEQALHKVAYLGRSDVLFEVLSEELFGEQGIAIRSRRRYDD